MDKENLQKDKEYELAIGYGEVSGSLKIKIRKRWDYGVLKKMKRQFLSTRKRVEFSQKKKHLLY